LFLLSACVLAQDKPRVFITDSKSWEIQGSGGGSNGTWASHTSGGARPQTAEIIKTFGEKCPQVTINNKQERADYVVLLDHEGGKGWIRKDNKVAVFNGDGDSIVSKSTRSLGSSVEMACEAISRDWTNGGAARAAARQQTTDSQPTPKPPDSATPASLHVSSQPSGADIEVDGNFVGSTPSTIQLSSGDHTVTVKKGGYKTWERKMKATGGDINLSVELEKAP
jgi:hypothetical protein